MSKKINITVDDDTFELIRATLETACAGLAADLASKQRDADNAKSSSDALDTAKKATKRRKDNADQAYAALVASAQTP